MKKQGNNYQEDRYIIRKQIKVTPDAKFWMFAVMDGHAGEKMAELTSKEFPQFIKRCLRELESSKDGMTFKESWKDLAFMKEFFKIVCMHFDEQVYYNRPEIKDDGCTANIIIIPNNVSEFKYMYCLNLGDSRMVAFDSLYAEEFAESQSVFTSLENGNAVYETVDHKPDSRKERSRIENAGGEVKKDEEDTFRVNGYLAVSRTLGDFSQKEFKNEDKEMEYESNYKEQFVTAKPDIYYCDLLDKKIAFPINIIFGSDGLFDFVKSKKIMQLYYAKTQDQNLCAENSRCATKGVYVSARDLYDLVAHVSEDNVTICSFQLDIEQEKTK